MKRNIARKQSKVANDTMQGQGSIEGTKLLEIDGSIPRKKSKEILQEAKKLAN